VRAPVGKEISCLSQTQQQGKERESSRERRPFSLSLFASSPFFITVDYHYTTSQKQVETVYTTLLGAQLKVRTDKITLSLQGKEKRQ
jgi:hypothetical protein